MAYRRKQKEEPEATESPPLPEVETSIAPAPENRAILSPKQWIRVKANRPIGEMDENGTMQRYQTGDTFTIDARRAKSLGTQVTVTEG